MNTNYPNLSDLRVTALERDVIGLYAFFGGNT